ncbi:putative 3-hydroxyisobutyrate dehydrogenase, mitochondrial [Cytospora mali]|uniref:3-hydroxyisobutyrate dehydrogenase n=1 Tax=Cytospora mali TaxID=578113 RepID=A0A194VW89_CYTMA|nr:putative 3-hydroxyisobutyrate dehydrogenase, mitochondrial [Valsa mali]
MRPTSTAWKQLRLQRRYFSSTPQRLDNYAFIGLGQMGFQMAKNLQAKLPPAGNVSIFDINREVMQRLAGEMKASQAGGASVELASSAADASKNADVTISALPEPSHVKKVYASILEARPGPRPSSRLFIDCSTIDPSSSQEVAASVAKAFPSGTAHFVDAPMSGGIVGAAAGTLTFMLGAPAEMVPRIEPILLRMGKTVMHCGEQGAGLSAKLANNYLLAINNIATAEAMNLGMRGVWTPRCWQA